MTAFNKRVAYNLAKAYANQLDKVVKGETKGRLSQAIALVKLLITQRFGEPSVGMSNQIADLPIVDLEDLVKVFLSFNRMADLEIWLQERLRSNLE
jgi:hypothetical protein